MTPKEKATELTCKYFNLIFLDLDYDQAQQCALMAVDEIINALPPYEYGLEFVAKFQYWLDVKIEIEQL